MLMTHGPRIRPFARFVRSDRGAVAPMIGLMLLVLIGCVGIAVDTGRGVLVRARLVDALDAAGLAVGARLSTADYTADAKKFVEANFRAGYSGATVKDVVATPNATKSVIALSATAEMPTAFMRLFGQELVTVRATSEVTRASAGLELVLVLDNTGSMEQSGSMPGLKSASKALLDTVFGGQNTVPNLFVGLVPFSQAVNIGPSKTLWTNPAVMASYAPYYPLYWTGCVEERLNGLDQTDAPPLTTDVNSLFRPYFAPDSWPKNSNNDWLSAGGLKIDIKYVDWTFQQGPSAYCTEPVTPMTNVKSKVEAAIDKMSARGATHINVGAAWGWRMLSPKWRLYWGGDMAANGLPLDYGTKRMSKAMVLMTDGENTMYDNTYTAFGKLSDNRLGTKTDTGVAIATLNSRLTAICNSVKATGIIVYSVAFDNPPKETKSLLETCATNSSYYFDAKNTAALTSAFKTIGDSLSNLRVSK